MMKRVFFTCFFSIIFYFSNAQEIEFLGVSQDFRDRNLLNFNYNLTGYHSWNNNYSSKEKYSFNLYVSKNTNVKNFKKLNLNNQNIPKTISPGDNQSFTIDVKKINELNEFFGNISSLEFKLEIIPEFIPIIPIGSTLVFSKSKKERAIIFYGPNNSVNYKLRMTDSFGEVVTLPYDNFASNINNELQYFGIIFKNFEKGLYTIEISKDKFGKDSIKQNIRIKGGGAKKVIIPMLVGGIVYGAYYFLFKDKGTKSSNPPPLPGPPLPGE